MAADALQEHLLPLFQWFHRHPELGNQEHETTARIKEILAAEGVEVTDSGLPTGLVAVIKGREGGPVVALRSDIDALPITEASGLPYSSENEGRMHACGHDFHLTAMLGAAILLKKAEKTLPGTVKLIFQPAEECGPGSKQVVKTGILDDVQEIYGLHVDSEIEPGLISVGAGPITAAVGGFRIIVKGKGGHAASPQECIDPIVAAAQIVNAAQTIVSRNLAPEEKAVVSITHLAAGNTWNVIPGEALMEGTIRTLGTEKFKAVAEKLGQIAQGIGAATGTTIEYFWELGAPSVNNDPALTDFVRETAQSLGFPVKPCPAGMGGEDFSIYQERIPGVFWFIGVGSPQAGHHPGFAADTTCLHRASELLAALGKGALDRLNKA
ncbi:putative hydrolase YxeP [Spirochaetia bacterium]|nr:putative hydrolase YxeP [Spirochaetia bacterium]